jgi:N4-gp56 family major capsid protein
MASAVTTISDIINPEVMADMISGKITNKIVVTPFAKIDTTLVGAPGSTITVPTYAYIGDAETVAEGVEAETVKLTATTTTATVLKAVKSLAITDEAVLSGFGNPVGEANNQLAKSIASKVDSDAMTALLTASLTYDGVTADEMISYDSIVNAIDVFAEEVNTEKVMFINPKQVTTLRKDDDFISADKYPGNVVMTGEIGMIANTRIVVSNKVTLVDDTEDYYVCPIVKLEQDSETEDETPALTIYLKRDTNVETERLPKSGKTDITVNKHYAAALSNASKVVLASFLAQEAV